MTVGELLRRVSARELTEWMAFAQLEPFGPYTEWYRSARLEAQQWNLQLKEGKRPFRPEEFLPSCYRRREDMDPMLLRQKISVAFNEIAARFDGRPGGTL